MVGSAGGSGAATAARAARVWCAGAPTRARRAALSRGAAARRDGQARITDHRHHLWTGAWSDRSVPWRRRRSPCPYR